MKNFTDIHRICVIGTGMMGPGIALSLAGAGYKVQLYGRTAQSAARGKANLSAACDRLVEYGLATRDAMHAACEHVWVSSDLAGCLMNVDLVVESITEDLATKQALFRQLTPLCPADVVLATNSSGISITQIAAAVDHPERFVGTHYWNPPSLMPLVEVIKGDQTSDETMACAIAVLEKSGKKTVSVNKDMPGFLGNRLQHALWREALALAEAGVASPADIDRMIKYSFCMRMPPIGVFEYMDMVGLDLVHSIHEYLFAELDGRKTASPLTAGLVAEGKLGMKSGQGFFSWTPEQVEERKRKRDAEVVRQLKLADEDGW